MKRSVFPVPDPLMIEVTNRVCRESQCCADNFTTFERRKLKELLGAKYAHVDEDALGIRAISLRKKGALDRVKYGKGTRFNPKLSEELLAHYESDEYRVLSDATIAAAGGRCRVCNAAATECHHRSYDSIGTEREADDVIAVCRKCHDVCDRRRRTQAEKRRKKVKDNG